ncbi:MAG: type II toxin-antitoxin system HicA family toxin [bacterium]
MLPGKEIVKALIRLGFAALRTRGDHVFMKHTDGRSTTVPLYDEIDRGLLRKILRDAEIKPAEFIASLK